MRREEHPWSATDATSAVYSTLGITGVLVICLISNRGVFVGLDALGTIFHRKYWRVAAGTTFRRSVRQISYGYPEEVGGCPVAWLGFVHH